MKIIARPRQGGKTTELVNMIKDNPNAVLLTPDKQRADRIMKEFNLPRERVYSINTFMSGHLRSKKDPNTEYYVDDLDDWINHQFNLASKGITAATVTDDTITWGKEEWQVKL